MIMSIVRHPIRAKYADDWPELAAEFTAATRAEPGNICFDWFRSVGHGRGRGPHDGPMIVVCHPERRARFG